MTHDKRPIEPSTEPPSERPIERPIERDAHGWPVWVPVLEADELVVDTLWGLDVVSLIAVMRAVFGRECPAGVCSEAHAALADGCVRMARAKGHRFGPVFSVVSFERRLSPKQRAALWNRSMRRLGYVELADREDAA